ncbi:dephospho-CoA kinase [Acetobacter sp. AN02]|uniref:dephospho-CoA kinase n=1 Tax=Acetobacter sp. AN02 TaxID=2894186 RepID=UPI0024344901|nr:dephospho-CoA kinase [Acetobacter sp. AN02]MDG6093749.1 dephospho-CoA kinase [Acetobacter sp. AN02]
MKILGLTGGMAMGKSTVAKQLMQAGLPVCDADAIVHALQAPGGAAVERIRALVPDAVSGEGKDAAIDRARLRAAALADPAVIKGLERIIHPLIRQKRRRFLRHHRRIGTPWVVLDIPLLFETGADRECDLTVTVSAPRPVQIRRVTARKNASGQCLSRRDAERLIARQKPDQIRRHKADIVLPTGLSLAWTRRQVRELLHHLRSETHRERT